MYYIIIPIIVTIIDIHEQCTMLMKSIRNSVVDNFSSLSLTPKMDFSKSHSLLMLWRFCNII